MNNNKWRTETLFLKQYCGHHDLSQLSFADGIKFTLKHEKGKLEKARKQCYYSYNQEIYLQLQPNISKYKDMNKCQHNYITETISEDLNKSFNTYDFRSNDSNLPVFIITLSSI